MHKLHHNLVAWKTNEYLCIEFFCKVLILCSMKLSSSTSTYLIWRWCGLWFKMMILSVMDLSASTPYLSIVSNQVTSISKTLHFFYSNSLLTALCLYCNNRESFARTWKGSLWVLELRLRCLYWSQHVALFMYQCSRTFLWRRISLVSRRSFDSHLVPYKEELKCIIDIYVLIYVTMLTRFD